LKESNDFFLIQGGNMQGIVITPKTKVGELLDSYPALEKVLMDMSPAFEKLRNPILRRTVAKVATLQQIAAVGGLKVDEIVNRLRKEAGHDTSLESGIDNEYLTDQPFWFDETKIVLRFDASPVINNGGSPMNDILSKTASLKNGEILELHTPFIPAPIIEMLMKKGYLVYCKKAENYVISYFMEQ
jgi:hypothetical protein